MIAYVDSSVLLRIVLRQPGALAAWPTIAVSRSSLLLEVECLRSIERLAAMGSIRHDAAFVYKAHLQELLREVELVEIDDQVRSVASSSVAGTLRTLDAIHLATALLWIRDHGVRPVFATHDKALALAARASGLEVIGA